jgi:hypothetical protein
LYKKVFGPIAKQSSKTGLCKVKFPAPKQHAILYICRYGSSDNFFGGNIESAFKLMVKAPTKITSRRHDHIAKDLASQQHERFICRASCIANANLMTRFYDKANMDSTQQRIRMRIADDSYSMATEKPMDWELHTPIFYLTCQGDGNWLTYLHSHMHTNLLVYPNFMTKVDTNVFVSGEQ